MRWLLALLVAVAPVLVSMGNGDAGGASVRGESRELPGGEPLAAPTATLEQETPPAAPRRRLPPQYPQFLHPLPDEPHHHVQKGPRPMRELLLTFDDGPDLMGTPLVLEELDRRGLKAIFFVNGRHIVGDRPQDLARREIARRTVAHGHMLANHTLSHQNVCKEPEKLAHQIDANADVIAEATGLRPLLFRAPYGVRCKRLDQALAERDLLQIGWNMDPQEWRGGSEQATYDYVTRKLAHFTGRAILLLHDTHSEAVRALPRILDWIDRENERARRVGELPIVIRDFRVFLPEPPLPETGWEPFAEDAAQTGSAIGSVVASLTASLRPPVK